MSGGGGGGSSSENWRGQAVGPGAEDDKCAIVEKTVLNSPNPTVITDLRVGNVLWVELEDAQSRRRLVVKTEVGDIAGAITSTRIADIIECIQKGFSYKAEVLAINAGRVEIEIRLACQR